MDDIAKRFIWAFHGRQSIEEIRIGDDLPEPIMVMVACGHAIDRHKLVKTPSGDDEYTLIAPLCLRNFESVRDEVD